LNGIRTLRGLKGSLLGGYGVSEMLQNAGCRAASAGKWRTLSPSCWVFTRCYCGSLWRNNCFYQSGWLKLIGAADESQLIGLPVMSVIHPDYVERSNSVSWQEWKNESIAADGRKIYPPWWHYYRCGNELQSRPFLKESRQFRLSWRDITEQKNCSISFFQSQKIQSIGTLAGGIAHVLIIYWQLSSGTRRPWKKIWTISQKHAESIAAIKPGGRSGSGACPADFNFCQKTDVVFGPVDVQDLYMNFFQCWRKLFQRPLLLHWPIHRISRILWPTAHKYIRHF